MKLDGIRRYRPELEALLSVDDVAAVLGISRVGVWRLIRAGELVATRIGGRTLFEPTDVRALIAKSKERPWLGDDSPDV
jgi:excisionase family DNA binding protein